MLMLVLPLLLSQTTRQLTTNNNTHLLSVLLDKSRCSFWDAWSALMINRSAARFRTWGGAAVEAAHYGPRLGLALAAASVDQRAVAPDHVLRQLSLG
jgi:hypothetical protein